jgi:hypothetical protein
MIRPDTVVTVCFLVLLASVVTGFSVWLFGMARRSFGAIPALLWLVLTCISLICAAIIGVLNH